MRKEGITIYYVMSDLHGHFEEYSEMLSKIRLKDSDSLFILGDICDKGPAPFRIMKDALMRCNVFPIIGDCDYKALRMLSGMQSEKTRSDPKFRARFAAWLSEGGTPTVTEFRALSEEEQTDVLEFIRDEFVAYDEVSAGDTDYVMVHAGLPGFFENKPLDDYSVKELTSSTPDFSREYFADKRLITGHTPTFLLDENSRGRIYRRNGQIGIDAGAAEGEALACLCLDTGEEFYV